MLTALSVTQTAGYGILYYAFSVFLTPVAVSLNTSVTVVAGALAVSVVVTGLAGISVGRWVDRRGGHRLMTTGSVLGTAAVVGWSQVHTVAGLYAVFVLIGVASAMVLYEPAFSVIIRTVSTQQRAGALLTVTIVAGFASSIFLPLAGLLNQHLGWRHALLVLAAIHLVTTVPLHAALLPPDRALAGGDDHRAAHNTQVSQAITGRGFWLLLTGFAGQGAAVAVIGVLLVTYLTTLGHTPLFAATIAGLLGVLSVTGRLVTTGLRRRLPIAAITAAVFVFQAAGAATLPWAGTSATGAIVGVILIGLGFGVATNARPAILAERYTTSAYASISGAMAAPMNMMKAGAPLGAAALAAGAAGYTPVMLTTAAVLVISAAVLIVASRS
jgi:predicted MFS family arabinose efflux permease